MFSESSRNLEGNIAEYRPAFNTPIVTINFLSTNPEGIQVATRYVMTRGEGFNSNPLTLDQKAELKQGMRDEVAFVLKRKGLFTNEIKNEEDPERKWDLIRKTIKESNTTNPTEEKIDLTKEMTYKLAIRNQELMGNTLLVDVKSIPYPMYVVGSSSDKSKESHEFTSIAAVAGALITKDGKLVVQMRSGNRIFDQVLGASAAGMFDSEHLRINLGKDNTTGQTHYLKGYPQPINTDTVKGKFFDEAYQEIAVKNEDIEDLKIVGTALDHTFVHDEFLLFGKLNLTAKELEERTLLAPRSQRKEGDFHFEEKFVFIDATPEAIETLLTQVKNPLPPTHLAAFVAAGYTMILDKGKEKAGYERDANLRKAEEWKRRVEEGVKRNYSEINRIVQEHTLRENGITDQRNIDRLIDSGSIPGYNPKIPATKQGLPDMLSELYRCGLITPEYYAQIPDNT